MTADLTRDAEAAFLEKIKTVLAPELEANLLEKIKKELLAESDKVLLVKVNVGRGENGSAGVTKPHYATPAEALASIHDRYNYWTTNLTNTSLNISLAVIACNWAVFGSVNQINNNCLSRWSILAALLSILFNLLGSFFLGEMHRERYYYAEDEPARWAKEFAEKKPKRDPWPSNKLIERTAIFLRWCKAFLPTIGGILFLFALLT